MTGMGVKVREKVKGSGPVKALGAIDDPTCPGYDDEYPEDNCSMPFSGSMERKA